MTMATCSKSSRSRSKTGLRYFSRSSNGAERGRSEKGLKIPFSERPRSAPLDDLEKYRRPVFDRLREDLEHVAIVIPVNQNAKFFQLFDRFVDRADALLKVLVVGTWDLQEFHVLCRK